MRPYCDSSLEMEINENNHLIKKNNLSEEFCQLSFNSFFFKQNLPLSFKYYQI